MVGCFFGVLFEMLGLSSVALDVTSILGFEVTILGLKSVMFVYF